MGKIKNVIKMTENRFLNLYHVQAENRKGGPVNYFVASRRERTEDLQLMTHRQHPDGVIIYSLYGEKADRVVLVRQYRYTIDDYIYEFPAGLVEPGEDYRTAAARELREETGLTLRPEDAPSWMEKPFYTTIGMTDECCATVYGYAGGEISTAGQEDNEEIEVILADREEARRILKEEKVAVVCAYMLMHFISEDDPFAFLR